MAARKANCSYKEVLVLKGFTVIEVSWSVTTGVCFFNYEVSFENTNIHGLILLNVGAFSRTALPV